MLVSTKICKPLETSPSRLIAIFCLINEAFDLGVFPNRQRGKGIVHNAARVFAAARTEALKPQSYYFFSLSFALWQLAQQLVRHLYFYRFHWKNLLQGILRAAGMGVKRFDRRTEERLIRRSFL